MSEDYNKIVEDVRATFMSGRTQDTDFRIGQLQALVRLLDDQRDNLADALYKDMKKPKTEAVMMEIDFSRNEIIDLTHQIKSWAKPEYVKRNMITLVASAYIKKEALGVVLVMGAWNYPVQLSLAPVAGAIAAGNCVILKPSELAPHVAALISQELPKYLDASCYKVICGGVSETTQLLTNRFDHIFYTGGSEVAKKVMAAASKYLTPVTLELGGKSPLYVDSNVNLKVAAQRIVWGKFTNCGQTCVAPDYLMCEKDMEDKVIAEIKQVLQSFYQGSMKDSKDYGRIINERHYKRLSKTLESTAGDVVVGGEMDESELFISPTLVKGVKRDDVLMQDEIFGPILPILTVSGVDEAITYINSREKPLALYVFSNDSHLTSKILDKTSSGTFVQNDVMVQLSVPTLPFGGVGMSGMGSYHGKFSFDTFSHHRAVLLADKGITEPINGIRYPPYSDKKLSWATWLMKKK